MSTVGNGRSFVFVVIPARSPCPPQPLTVGGVSSVRLLRPDFSGSGRASLAKLLPSQGDDDRERLKDDSSAHLRSAKPPVPERDRDFGDGRPCPARSVGHFDLEDVAACANVAAGD